MDSSQTLPNEKATVTHPEMEQQNLQSSFQQHQTEQELTIPASHQKSPSQSLRRQVIFENETANKMMRRNKSIDILANGQQTQQLQMSKFSQYVKTLEQEGGARLHFHYSGETSKEQSGQFQLQKAKIVKSFRNDILQLDKIKVGERRESFFGNQYEAFKVDPLNKIIQPQLFIENGQNLLKEQASQKFLRTKSSATLKKIEHICQVRTESANTFKNEYLQKTLGNTTNISERQTLSNLKRPRNIMNKERLNLAITQDSQALFNNMAVQRPLTQECLSKTLLLNQDAIQVSEVISIFNEYNAETSKYSSSLIHLEVLLKKALSFSEVRRSQPSTFLTQICVHILDKLTFLFPQIGSLFVPLKNALLSSIFYKFDQSKHKREDDQEIACGEKDNEKDLLKIHSKFLNYETFHDRLRYITKENKELRTQLQLMKIDKSKEKRNDKILERLVQKMMKEKMNAKKKQVFELFKIQTFKRYKQMFLQLSENTSFGEKAAQKMLLRKCFMEWQIYRMNQKQKRLQKEIQYYQGKFDESESLLAQARGQVSILQSENLRLQGALQEKQNRLETRHKELVQAKVTSSNKQPYQVRKILKLYLKFMFSNPYIARIRLQQELGLPSFRSNSKAITDEQQTTKRQSVPLNLKSLLKKREYIQEGGLGIQTLFGLSLRDLMLRWASLMVEKAAVKLNKIIEILDTEVKIRRYNKLKKREQGFADEENEQESCESDSDEEHKIVGQKAQNTGESSCLNILNSGNIVTQAPSHIKPYMPFKNYKRDLKYLLTFRTMLSHVLTDFASPSTTLPILLGILFAMSHAERKIMLSNSDFVGALGSQGTLQQPPQRLSVIMMPYSLITGGEQGKEEVSVHDYRQLLLFVADTDQASRAQLVMQQYELIMQQKLSEWYLQPIELLTGRESIYTSLFANLFYWQQSSTSIRFDKKEQMSQEQHLESKLLKRVIQAIRTKCQPILQRRVNAQLQDLCLLLNESELESENKALPASTNKVLETLTKLPYHSTRELIVRWINHLLNEYKTIKAINDREMKIKEKFQQKQSNKAIQDIASQSRQTVTISSSQQQLMGSLSTRSQQRGKSQIIPSKLSVLPSQQLDVLQQIEEPKDIYKVSLVNLELELIQDNYQRLITMLAWLCPEALWDMQDFDYMEIARVPNFVQIVEKFISHSNDDTRLLFITTAFERITKKIHLVSISDLKSQLQPGQVKVNFEELLIELFLKRPYLTSFEKDTVFVEELQKIEDFYSDNCIYLQDFGKEQLDMLQTKIDALKSQRVPIIQAFAYVQDCERIYNALTSKLLLQLSNSTNPRQLMASQIGINNRALETLSQIEQSILMLNKDWLFELVSLRQPYLNIQWGAKLELTLKKYLYPLKREIGIHCLRSARRVLGDYGTSLSYFQVWNAVKQLHIRTFNLDYREVEQIIIKVARLKEKEKRSRKAGFGGGTSTNIHGSHLDDNNFNFNEDVEKEQQELKRQLKNEMLAQEHSSPGNKFRIKASTGKLSKGDSMEKLGLLSPYYRTQFTPSDFVLIIISILFKVAPQDFIREMIILNPLLKDDALKNVNRMLSREKVYIHVEQYLADFAPGITFESFLVNNVLSKAQRINPNSLNMLKEDFRQYLDSYLDSLYAIFDFYMCESQSNYPQTANDRYLVLQPEGAYLFFQDLDAFNPETGLHRQSLKKIFQYVQRPISQEQHLQAVRTYEGIINSHFGANNQSAQNQLLITNQSSQALAKNQESQKQQLRAQPQAMKSQSQKSKSQNRNESGAQITKSGNALQSSTNQASQPLNLSQEGFVGLTFYDFIDMIYNAAQYYNPDPYINSNQKFADFLEKVVFVHVQFKIKNKRLQETPHKERLVNSLNKQRIIRGTQLETYNSLFNQVY